MYEDAVKERDRTRQKHAKKLLPRLVSLRTNLNLLIIRARDAHKEAMMFYKGFEFHGGLMRNLDDLVMHLENAREEITTYKRQVDQDEREAKKKK